MRIKFISEWFDDILEQMHKKTGCDDPDIYAFPQMWGSTALGYNGVGCSAMTTGTTIILWDETSHIAMVYLGKSLLGYAIKNPNQEFWNDVNKHNMLPAYVIQLDSNHYGELLN